MLLGKRPRGPMKRTTSMSEITLDLNKSSDVVVDPISHFPFINRHRPSSVPPTIGGATAVGAGGQNSNILHFHTTNNNNGVMIDRNQNQNQIHENNNNNMRATPRIQRRHSGDFAETPHFLRSCSLCRRRLVPGRDIYMYRGDSAFCSLECRQHQMNQDEKKDKFFVSSKKQVVAHTPSGSSSSQAQGVKYGCFAIEGDEDLQVLFHCRRQFPEVRTTELFVEIVDPLASFGGSAPNPHSTNAAGPSRPVIQHDTEEHQRVPEPLVEEALQPDDSDDESVFIEGDSDDDSGPVPTQ
ncbi:hypothetical protein PIB30_074342 [Stylosanthes scabra]|uniref:FLZ-type domain-containing protein n=1 Tax=Stylosanthes scabra TaxID=79078 RepID=A0ABU6RQ19_9FABA|nr:hypothetical protein [Stylosanthes scabra]